MKLCLCVWMILGRIWWIKKKGDGSCYMWWMAPKAWLYDLYTHIRVGNDMCILCMKF